MPSIVTHHLFAKDLLNKIKTPINHDIYYIFAQSFDNLFYYKFFTPFLGKKIRNLGTSAQQTNINLYFKNILLEIKNNHLEQNKDILAYLYGSYTHYILDSTTHPFIIYYSGITSINSKYRGGHEKFEVMLDAILYKQKTNKNLKDSSLANTLLPQTNFSPQLKSTLNNVFIKTFSIPNLGNIYEKSYKTGHTILKYFVTDHTGIKKNIYKIKDIFGKNRMYQYLSFHINTLDYSILNLSHQKWIYPTNKKYFSTLSFEDLLTQAEEKTLYLINQTNLYLNNSLSLTKLLKIIEDNSYITGLNWKDNSSFKYFSF